MDDVRFRHARTAVLAVVVCFLFLSGLLANLPTGPGGARWILDRVHAANAVAAPRPADVRPHHGFSEHRHAQALRREAREKARRKARWLERKKRRRIARRKAARQRRHERERLHRYYAEPRWYGRAVWYSQRTRPSWWSGRLVTWHGVVLEEHAMRALQAASLDVGHAITGGGYRSHATQCAMDGKAGVAPCGTSYHEVGLAIDLSPNTSSVYAALRRHGWHQLPGESWHWSYGVSG